MDMADSFIFCGLHHKPWAGRINKAMGLPQGRGEKIKDWTGLT
jgi:hypothetical protein